MKSVGGLEGETKNPCEGQGRESLRSKAAALGNYTVSGGLARVGSGPGHLCQNLAWT